MGWYLTGFEKLRCPPEYQAYVTAVGGKNRFGEPNFKIAWGQTETEYIYGVDANGRKGQHVVFKHQGIPAWFIEVWRPPECFGTPELWYSLSWDPESQKHTLGEYPWRGQYMPAPFHLYVKRVSGGGIRYSDPDKNGHRHVIEEPMRVVYDAMPLNYYILELTIPNMLKELNLTAEQKRVAMANIKAAETARSNKLAFDAYLDAAPAFGGNAFSKESNREAWMQKLKEKQAGLKLSAEDVKKILGKSHKVH